MLPVTSARPPRPVRIAPDWPVAEPIANRLVALMSRLLVAARMRCPASIGRRGVTVPFARAACVKALLAEEMSISEYRVQTAFD